MGSWLDLYVLDLLTGHLLFNGLQETLPVFVVVVIRLEFGPGHLADESLGGLPAQVNVPTAIRFVFSSAWASTR